MNSESGLFKMTTTFVKIAHIMSLVGGVLLPVIALVAAFVPSFLAASGTFGMQIDAVGLKIDLTNGVDPASWRAGFVVSFAAGAVSAWALVYIFSQLRQLLKRVGDGDPFSRENAVRITRVGLAVIAAALVEAIGKYALGSYIRANVSIPGVTLRPFFQFPFGTVLLGLIILCLAEAFRYGACLQEEHDLTV